MDHCMGDDGQQYSEAEIDRLRFGALVPARNVGDRAGTTAHDSRLRWLPARALSGPIPGAGRPGACEPRKRFARASLCRIGYAVGVGPWNLVGALSCIF